MSPDKQRIAIAEACGWRPMPHESKQCYDPSGLSCYWSDAPDYLNDLNAIHEAEKALRSDDEGNEAVGNYRAHLIAVMDAKNFTWVVMFATAAQRCEAFLKTIGKWEDEG